MAVLFTLALAFLVAGCDQEAEAPAPAPVPVVPTATPMHGGSLVTLRAHRVELRAHRSGEIFGYLTRSNGGAVPSPESALMSVTMTVDEDHPRPVLLRWNGGGQRYEARLREEPLEGPADVQLMLGGEVERGSLDRLLIDEALTESGVAYAEADEVDEDEPLDEAADEDEAGSSGGGRGGGIRDRARRLFRF